LKTTCLFCVFGLQVVLSVLLAVFGLVASSQLKTGLSQREVLPGDSYVLQYFETESHYFGGASYQISIIFQSFDYSDRDNQNVMIELYETLKKSPLLEKEMHFWLIDFFDWLPRSTFADRLVDGRPSSETEFYIALYNFLINPTYGPKYLTDIVFQSGFIKTCRFGARHIPFPSDLQKADAMLEIQATVAKAKVPTIAYGYHYLYWAQYVGLISSSVSNFAMVSVGIFLFLWIFLGSISLSIIVLLNIVLVDMELLAVMYVWDIGLTQVSLVLLLLSIGLAVDSCAHVAHAWVTSKQDSAQERSMDALRRMGPSVFSGALTSFLGILILGISNHRVLLALFKFFFSMFLLAMWHGLLFLPTVLSFLPDRKAAVGLENIKYSGIEQKEDTIQEIELD
jgi:predicted RND superfamily exporter protein